MTAAAILYFDQSSPNLLKMLQLWFRTHLWRQKSNVSKSKDGYLELRKNLLWRLVLHHLEIEELTYETSWERKLREQRCGQSACGQSASGWKCETHTHGRTVDYDSINVLTYRKVLYRSRNISTIWFDITQQHANCGLTDEACFTSV